MGVEAALDAGDYLEELGRKEKQVAAGAAR